MATKRLNLRKVLKIISLEAVWGINETAEMFIALASTKVVFFIAFAYILWLLWQLRVSIDLQWEK